MQPLVERARTPEYDPERPSDWMTTTEAAHRLAVSVRTLCRALQAGDPQFRALKVRSVWRVWRADVDRYHDNVLTVRSEPS